MTCILHRGASGEAQPGLAPQAADERTVEDMLACNGCMWKLLEGLVSQACKPVTS